MLPERFDLLIQHRYASFPSRFEFRVDSEIIIRIATLIHDVDMGLVGPGCKILSFADQIMMKEKFATELFIACAERASVQERWIGEEVNARTSIRPLEIPAWNLTCDVGQPWVSRGSRPTFCSQIDIFVE